MTEPKIDEDLQIIQGEQTIALSDGREVVVREYRAFLEGLKVDAIAQRFEADLADTLAALDTAGDNLLLHISAAFGRHAATLVELLLLATDLSEADIAALDDDDGQLLLATWWALNSHFFMRRVTRAVLTQRVARERQADNDRKLAKYREQAKSLSGSSTPGSGSTRSNA